MESMTLAHKCHINLWRHMKLFSVECKHWMLFRNMYASISNKIQQEIISNYFLSHCFSRIQYGDSFTQESLVTVCQLWIWQQALANEKTYYIIFALEYRDSSKIYNIQKYLMNLNFQEKKEATVRILKNIIWTENWYGCLLFLSIWNW